MLHCSALPPVLFAAALLGLSFSAEQPLSFPPESGSGGLAFGFLVVLRRVV